MDELTKKLAKILWESAPLSTPLIAHMYYSANSHISLEDFCSTGQVFYSQSQEQKNKDKNAEYKVFKQRLTAMFCLLQHMRTQDD